MEARADALLSTLTASAAGAAPLLSAAALDDVPATISVLPRKRHAALAAALLRNVRALGPPPATDAPRRAAAALALLCLRDKKAPTPPDLLAVAAALADGLPAMRAPAARNAAIKVAEGFCEDGRAGADALAPLAAAALLDRSLAAEAGGASSAEDVRRVYALRAVLFAEDRDWEATEAAHPRLRPLLVRAVTSALYLKVPEGQKLIARMLFEERMTDPVHAALLSMLPIVRKSRAVAVGAVYVHAWKTFGGAAEDRFATVLQDVLQKAVRASADPLATNLRTVLSSFHANKKLTGMDGMLCEVYTPILFRALTAANPLVRRNATVILADCFPIHNPTMSNAELEAVLDDQCGKLLTLLRDPVPLVRVSAVEGACRVLGLLWELVPPVFTKKWIQVITGELAFDKASAHVRAAVCDGLRFVLDNHLTHPLMAVALPRLENMLHDTSERVRLSFLHLLLTLKAKRILSARYFDVVPLEDFLLRLPVDSPAVAAKIMQLLVTSFFPLERKNKTGDEIAASQVRACLEMMRKTPDAANTFYSLLSMYIPPGPLVEFCIRITTLAISGDEDLERETASPAATPPPTARKGRRRRVASSENSNGVDNFATPPPKRGAPTALSGSESAAKSCRKEQLLALVAVVLQSIAPSLRKPALAPLRSTVVDVFGGASLLAMVVPRGNSLEQREAALKIAGTLNSREVAPIVVEWKRQFEALPGHFSSDPDGESFSWIARALHCGFAWDETEYMCKVLSAWSDTAFTGRRAASAGGKATKRPRRGRGSDVSSVADDLRVGVLRSLSMCARACLDSTELRQVLLVLSKSEQNSDTDVENQHVQELPAYLRMVAALCRGAMRAIDVALEGQDEMLREACRDQDLLSCLASAMQLSVFVAGTIPDIGQEDSELAVSSQLDILEIIQWASGRQVLSAAFARSDDFGSTLASVVMTQAADGAALGKLPLSVGSRYLAQLATNVKEFALPECLLAENVVSEASLRFAMSACTASYHLLENVCAYACCESLDGDDVNTASRSGAKRTPVARLEDIQGLLEAAASILGRCPMTTHASYGDALAMRFSEMLLTFSSISASGGWAFTSNLEGFDRVARTLSHPMSTTLADFSGSEKNDTRHSALLALFVGAVVGLARKQPRGIPETCAQLLTETMLIALKEEPAQSRSRFLVVLANAILDAYPDTAMVPPAVCHVSSAIKAHISQLCSEATGAASSEASPDNLEELAALSESLGELRLAGSPTQSPESTEEAAGIDSLPPPALPQVGVS